MARSSSITKGANENQYRLIVLNNFFKTQDAIILYNDKKEFSRLFDSIAGSLSQSTDSQLIYIYPREMDRLKQAEYYEGKNLRSLPILDRKYKKLFEEDILNLQKRLTNTNTAENTATKILIDFENTLTPENIDHIVKLKRSIEEKFKGQQINQFYAIETHSLDKRLIEKIVSMGEKFVIATSNDYIIFSSFPPIETNVSRLIESVSVRDLEDRVKKSIDIIVYAILLNSDKCGFDVIKEIVQNFNVLLSQGTVYPILYELTKKGMLDSKIQADNKTRLYTPTEEGRRFFKGTIDDYMSAQEKVTTFIKSQIGGQK